jgi:hypothetical protein
MGLFTLRCAAQCGDSPRQVFWQTNCYESFCFPTDILNVQTPPGIWKHATRPIFFTLVVDDFGVKYVGKEHINHLIKCIKTKYELANDWAGELYCGIKLNWDYTACTLDISMLGYITKVVQKYKHCIPSKPQCCPYSPAPKQYGKQAQAPIPVDISPKLSPDDVKQIQQIVGSILYYAWAVDITVLMVY